MMAWDASPEVQHRKLVNTAFLDKLVVRAASFEPAAAATPFAYETEVATS